jgi:hypothetical protein
MGNDVKSSQISFELSLRHRRNSIVTTNQPINQSTNYSTTHSSNQSINQSSEQPTERSSDQAIKRSTNQTSVEGKKNMRDLPFHSRSQVFALRSLGILSRFLLEILALVVSWIRHFDEEVKLGRVLQL